MPVPLSRPDSFQFVSNSDTPAPARDRPVTRRLLRRHPASMGPFPPGSVRTRTTPDGPKQSDRHGGANQRPTGGRSLHKREGTESLGVGRRQGQRRCSSAPRGQTRPCRSANGHPPSGISTRPAARRYREPGQSKPDGNASLITFPGKSFAKRPWVAWATHRCRFQYGSSLPRRWEILQTRRSRRAARWSHSSPARQRPPFPWDPATARAVACSATCFVEMSYGRNRDRSSGVGIRQADFFPNSE